MDMATVNEVRMDLVLALLEAELKNAKLLLGLRQAGLVVEKFYTDLGEKILLLIGFSPAEISDELLDFYFEKIEHATELPLVEFWENLQEVSLEIYRMLKERKQETLLMSK